MKRTSPAANPADYLASLDGWRARLVTQLRDAVLSAGALQETIKWGHLVYLSGGPVLLIRAEDTRVLFGFWRGQRLRDHDVRLVAGGKYEMATMVLGEDSVIDSSAVTRLVDAAIALNAALGDPTAVVRRAVD